MNDVPRRNKLYEVTPAERAIYDAVQAVEAMAADVRLTNAVILLQAARDSVADFVDEIDKRRRVVEEPAVPSSSAQAMPLIERISLSNNTVRYRLEGHDETLAFSTGNDANKVWELMRRIAVAAVPSSSAPEDK